MSSTRFIIMSDCHRGDGSAGDEFAHNSLFYKCALEHYYQEGYTYIELGDAEELWENKDFEQIYITHTSIYDLLQKFHDPDPAKTRYIKIWGNHDEYWQDHASVLQGIFPDIRVHEAVVLSPPVMPGSSASSSFNKFILRQAQDDKEGVMPGPSKHDTSSLPMLLIHGHQADIACCGLGAKVSKFFVRHVWSGLQKIGIGDPTRAAENPGLCNAIDEILHAWATGKETEGPKLSLPPGNVPCMTPDGKPVPAPPFIIIAGHTHRPVFANLSQTERRYRECGVGLDKAKIKDPEPVYYNTGSCVHPRCITGLEIDFEKSPPVFILVKWSYQTGAEVCTSDGSRTWPLAITRTILQT